MRASGDKRTVKIGLKLLVKNEQIRPFYDSKYYK